MPGKPAVAEGWEPALLFAVWYSVQAAECWLPWFLQDSWELVADGRPQPLQKFADSRKMNCHAAQSVGGDQAGSQPLRCSDVNLCLTEKLPSAYVCHQAALDPSVPALHGA